MPSSRFCGKYAQISDTSARASRLAFALGSFARNGLMGARPAGAPATGAAADGGVGAETGAAAGAEAVVTDDAAGALATGAAGAAAGGAANEGRDAAAGGCAT